MREKGSGYHETAQVTARREIFLPNCERAKSTSHGNAVDYDVIDGKDLLAFHREHNPAVYFMSKSRRTHII